MLVQAKGGCFNVETSPELTSNSSRFALRRGGSDHHVPGHIFAKLRASHNCSVPEDFDYSASISVLEVREALPGIDPEALSPQNVLEILLYLFGQKPGFIDRGHEVNNKETAWVNAYLFRLKPVIREGGEECFEVETVGSSVDKMAKLR
jgi:hypothetical protein